MRSATNLVVDRANARSSKLMAEVEALKGSILIQLAMGIGTFDLMGLTEGFTVSGTMPFLDVLYGTTGMPGN